MRPSQILYYPIMRNMKCVRIGGDSNSCCYTKKCLRILQRIINNNLNPKQPAKRIKDQRAVWYMIFLRASNLTFEVIAFR